MGNHEQPRFDLGKAFRFYDYLPESIRFSIARRFQALYAETHFEDKRITHKDLKNAFDHIKDFRNRCAHDERLYCARIDKSGSTKFKGVIDDLELVLTAEQFSCPTKGMTRMRLIRHLVATRLDSTDFMTPLGAAKIALKRLAKRYVDLDDEASVLDDMIAAILADAAPLLVQLKYVGAQSAAQLMVAVGDNPERLRSEASFAMLCGVAPVPVSSGMTYRHRLNRGGDRQANSAIYIIAIGRLRTDERTKEYVAKKMAEGHTKMEAIRCLKRYIAREVYYTIKQQHEPVNCS